MVDGIAIVGMAGLFPGAPDVATYWRNIEAGVDAIAEAPASRWDPVYYDPAAAGPERPDRLYCKRGGFVDAHAAFDALAFGIMPVAAQGAEPDQLLTLQVTARALADAGIDQGHNQRNRTGVIFGRGGYLTAGIARLNQYVRTGEQLVATLRDLVPGIDRTTLEAVRAAFHDQVGPCRPDSVIGLVPNLVASRVANRLDLHGPAYTVDGACASSLVAVDQACAELERGRCDLMIAGGVHICHDITFWSVFSQLGALSRQQHIRPFDRRADGLLIGEGIGVVVLKRLADAERHGDHIYAVIRGTGVSSDGRASTLMKPRVSGQIRALEEAWRSAGIDPRTVGLIEAHGTATPAGDEAELRTLREFFGLPSSDEPRDSRPGLGSIKSMIGHAMPAAGIAGLIKAALAVYHGVLPPTLHCEDPHPLLGETRFRPIAAAEPWRARGTPRRAGINAFGFGGINAHAVIEAHDQGLGFRVRRVRHGAQREDASGAAHAPLLLIAAADAKQLVEVLDGKSPGCPDGPCRLALFDPTDERRARARAIVEQGRPWSGRYDIFFSPRGLAADDAKVAFLFPGIEAAFTPRADDIATHYDLPALPAVNPGDLESHGLAVVHLGRMLHAVLLHLGIVPDAIAGHSVGEWTGMMTAGMLPPGEVDTFIASLVPGSLEVPDVVFAAVGCGVDMATQALAGLDEISISHDNCPHQAILCGREASIEVAVNRLRKQRVLCQILPFRSGFHSPMFADYLGLHRDNFARMPLQAPITPIWSATTCAPYPQSIADIRVLALQHLVEPVRFRQLVEALYDHGARIFVQLGMGSLTGFCSDTLRGRPHLAISANMPRRSGLAQLRRVAVALYVEGLTPAFENLPGTVISPTNTTGQPAAASQRPRGTGGRPSAGPMMQLALGAPLVTVSQRALSRELFPQLAPSPAGAPAVTGDSAPVNAAAQASAKASANAAANASTNAAANTVAATICGDLQDPILAEFNSNMQHTLAAQCEVQQVWQRAPMTVAAPTREVMNMPAHTIASAPARTIAETTTSAIANPAGAQAIPPVGANTDDKTLAPRESSITRIVSVDAYPELIDHTFYRQAADWPHLEDRYPVVPMTMHIDWMQEAARALVPERTVVAMEAVRAYRWLAAAPPIAVAIEARFDGRDRVAVRVGDYSQGTVVLGHDYAEPPAADAAPLTAEASSDMTAQRLYDERWMFHGSAYRGVVDVTTQGSDGIRGTLVALPARGALLDNVGQLFGYWVMRNVETNRLAFPIQIQRIDFYGPPPPDQAHLPCTVRVTRLSDTEVEADMDLCLNGQVWARFRGWVDRRFDTDPVLWSVFMFPENNGMGAWDEDGNYRVTEHWRAAASRELVARRYFGPGERAFLGELGPRERRGWLLGRIALKDAARQRLWDQGHRDVFPGQIDAADDPAATLQRAVRVKGPLNHDLWGAVAYAEGLAVARLASGAQVGIGLARIRDRDRSFVNKMLTDLEIARFCPSPGSGGTVDSVWLARIWAAKQAGSKALGIDLAGDLQRFQITEVAGERLLVEYVADHKQRIWVQTRQDGPFVLAWNCDQGETNERIA